MRRALTAAGVVVLLWGALAGAIVPPTQASNATVARITQGPTIEYADDQFAVVTWTTDVPTESRVYYGTSEKNLTQVSENRNSRTFHRLDLQNLQPSTTYYFRIDNGTPSTLASNSFQTVATGANAERDLQPARLNQPVAAAITNGPSIQYADDTSAVITWSTSTPSPSRVYYGTSQTALSQTAEEPGANTYHRVHLSGLQGGSTYFFQVDTGQDTRNQEARFQTVAAGAQPVFDQSPQALASGTPQLQSRPAAPAGQATATQAAPAHLTIPAGTEIDATLQDALSSKTAKTGDTFTAVLAQPVRAASGAVAIPAGTVINGEVTESEQGKTLPMVRGKGRLAFRFKDMTLPSHRSFPLEATLLSVHDKKAGSEGEVTSSTGGKTVAKDVGIGAGLGTVAGLIFGSALKGLAIGAIAGGGYVLATQGKDVEIPAQSGMKLRLDQALNIPAGAVAAAPAPSQ
ncbi:MAG TPA: fibronectin type III domain-containing protein [Terriglobales bacterium]|nr:fibronectin type III domain-containing protein [Terriglobales bacterium]